MSNFNEIFQKNMKPWVSFQDQGIKATRFKNKLIVYSDKTIKKEIRLNLEHHEVFMNPINNSNIRLEEASTKKYPSAFICEVISNNCNDINKSTSIPALDEIFTWLEFDYILGEIYEREEEYNGEWVSAPALSFSCKIQMGYPDLPKENLQSFLKIYEKVKKVNSKRGRKVITVRQNLQEGLRLRDISKKYSFLAFYNVIEMISDDLVSKKYHETDDPVIKELIEFQLIKGQRSKIYYILKAIKNDFQVRNMLKLANLRNTATHSDENIDNDLLDMCQKLAYWSAEQFIRIISSDK